MKIANIVIEKEHEKFLKKVDFIEYFNDYKGIPKRMTLIIGWGYTKKLFPNLSSLSILNKKLSNLTYWTFSRTEKRSDLEKDLQSFYLKIFENLKNENEYRFINIFQTGFEEISSLLRIIKSNDKTHVYVHNNSFIYLHHNNVIYGLNLDDTEYLGIQKKKILNLLYKTPNNNIFYNLDFTQKEVYLLLREDKTLIPIIQKIINE